MNQIKLVAVVAMASNRVIGKDGDLPWYLPEDLKFFKATTRGSKVLMGRKTFDSIVQRLGKPLPGRLNLVLSSTLATPFPADQVRVFSNLETLRAEVDFEAAEVVYLIGGAQLYQSLLLDCEEILLSFVYQEYEGDAYFPSFEDHFELKKVIFKTEDFEVRRYVRLQ